VLFFILPDPLWSFVSPMTPQEKQKLQQAQALIKNRQFQEARQLPVAMPSNPTAQERLFKLDQLIAKERAASARPAAPPPDPFAAPTRDPLAAPPLSSFADFAELPNIPASPSAKKQGAGAWAWGCLRLFGAAVRLILRLMVGVIVIIGLGALTLFAYRALTRFEDRTGMEITWVNGGGTFNHEYVSVTYPNRWYSADLSERSWCRGEAFSSCILYLETVSSVRMPFNFVPVPAGWTAEQTAYADWVEYSAPNSYRRLELVSEQKVMLDGVRSVWREFRVYKPDAYFYFLRVQTFTNPVIQITVWARDDLTFENKRADILDILNTLDIKAPPA
jgi:hypothetical protein